MKANEVDVSIQMVMYGVPYKKRKLPRALDEFCSNLDKKFTKFVTL